MKHATFEEYEAAKLEVIKGVDYVETTQSPNQWGMMSKQYSTEENGTFYEVTDPNTGSTEFWSDKHPESRIYNGAAKAQKAKEVAQQKPITFCEMHKSSGCEECLNCHVCKNSTLQEKRPQTECGRKLAEKIRTTTTDFSKLSDYERFVINRGSYYDTEEKLKAAYDRNWKSRHDILITEDEFVAEAGKGGSNTFSQWNEEATREVYKTLAALAADGKITNSEVYSYAVFGWCIRKPESIVAYQEGRDEWIVNNCAEEITEEAARVAVCEEWGFEASRVQIIGTPYYDATDWQFIRFDCGHMTWLWKNGNLYQVYAD